MCLWLLEPPVLQNFDAVGNREEIEASFILLHEQVKTLQGNALIAPLMPLGLDSEILDSVDVIDVLDERFRVVNPDVMKLGNVQNIVGTETVGVGDGVWPHLVLDDWKKTRLHGYLDDNDMNLTHSATPALPFLRPSK